MFQDGREPTPRSDIYSLGVVAIEMWSGMPVVASDDAIDALEIPEAAAELLRAMTSPLAENRPLTADALLSRLLRLRSGSTSPLRPVAQEKGYPIGRGPLDLGTNIVVFHREDSLWAARYFRTRHQCMR